MVCLALVKYSGNDAVGGWVVRTYALTLVPRYSGVFGEVNLYILFANELPTVIFSIVLWLFFVCLTTEYIRACSLYIFHRNIYPYPSVQRTCAMVGLGGRCSVPLYLFYKDKSISKLLVLQYSRTNNKKERKIQLN